LNENLQTIIPEVTGFCRQQVVLAAKTLFSMCPSHDLAQKMGEKLGQREVLFRPVPKSSSQTFMKEMHQWSQKTSTSQKTNQRRKKLEI
jgi:hypothetical protein